MTLVAYDLSICGLAEIPDFAGCGVSHALSILDPEWPDPPAFAKFVGCRRDIFHFHDIIDEGDGVAPSREDVRRILDIGERLQGEGVRHLLIHCHAGVSRSTATAAILLAQFNPWREEEAFRQLAGIRPWSWPNSRMVEFADGLLERQGRLVAAMRGHHARMIQAWPELAAPLRDGDRAREFHLAG